MQRRVTATATIKRAWSMQQAHVPCMGLKTGRCSGSCQRMPTMNNSVMTMPKNTPAIDQVINASSELVSRHMTEHDDAVGRAAS